MVPAGQAMFSTVLLRFKNGSSRSRATENGSSRSEYDFSCCFVQVLTAETRFLKTREPVRTFFYLARGDGALGLRGSPPTPVGCACRLRGVSCKRGIRL